MGSELGFIQEALTFALSNKELVGASLLVIASISYKAKRQALARANGQCEADGPHRGALQAAHKNHLKDDKQRAKMGLPPYDSADSVRILCEYDHALDHEENEGKNGLTKRENRWSIFQIINRMEGREDD